MESVMEKTEVSLDEKCERAAKRFLEKQGYEIVDVAWDCSHGQVDLIAKNEDVLVFIDVRYNTPDDGFKDNEKSMPDRRETFERIAFDYLKSHKISECAVRADEISFLICAEDRAFLRHHINALNSN